MGIWAVDNGLLLIGNGLELGNYGSMDGCGNLGYMYVCMYAWTWWFNGSVLDGYFPGFHS